MLGERFSKKNSNTKFHQNPFTENRVVQCEQTDRHEEGSNFAHAPKNGNITSELYVGFRSRYYITISLKSE